jgi:hypothetical protein
MLTGAQHLERMENRLSWLRAAEVPIQLGAPRYIKRKANKVVHRPTAQELAAKMVSINEIMV